MMVLCWVAGLTLHGRVRGSKAWGEGGDSGIDLVLLLIERRQIRSDRHLIRMRLRHPPEELSRTYPTSHVP